MRKMILSSADILRILGGDPILRLTVKVSIVDGKPPLTGEDGTYIYIDRFPVADEFEATWKLWLIDYAGNAVDIILAQINKLLPNLRVRDSVLAYELTTTDFLSSNTQLAPKVKDKAQTKQANLDQYEARFQALAEDLQDQMLLMPSGKPGRDGKDGVDGKDGKDGRDLVATDANLEDLKNVEEGIQKEKGQVLTWNGSQWTNLFIPQSLSSGGGGGGTDLPAGEYENQPLTWNGTSWQPGSSVQFDISNTVDPAEGAITWEQDEHTAVLGINGIHAHIGHDQFAWCRNSTNATITKGTAVMFTGTLGNSGRLLVAPMISNGTVPGYVLLGIAAENIAPGVDGNVYSYGKIKGVDTSSFTEGAILWCNPSVPGGLTETEPTAPNLKLPIAAVISKGNNGIIMVRTTAGSRLQDLHNVNATNPTNGQVLAYNASTARWEASSTAGGGGIPEAPQDGNYYVRYNGQWIDLVVALSAYDNRSFDGGNFTTGTGNAVDNATFDGGDFR